MFCLSRRVLFFVEQSSPAPLPSILQVKLITSSFFERISNQNSLQPATPRRLYYPPGDTQIFVRAFLQQQLFVLSVS